MTHTPWGAADHSEQIAPGIHWHSTPSHGGFYLSPDKNKLVPLNVRRATFNGQGLRGWYEEDCDWSVVVRFFPEHFTGRAARQRALDVRGGRRSAMAARPSRAMALRS